MIFQYDYIIGVSINNSHERIQSDNEQEYWKMIGKFDNLINEKFISISNDSFSIVIILI